MILYIYYEVIEIDHGYQMYVIVMLWRHDSYFHIKSITITFFELIDDELAYK